MNTPNRASQQVGKKTLKPQVKSGKPAQTEDDQIFLLIGKDGENLHQVEISPADLAGIRDIARRSGTSVEDVLKDSVRHILGTLDTLEALETLNYSIIKAHALLQLISDKFDYLAHREGTESRGSEVSHFGIGIGHLVTDVQNSLKNDYRAMFLAVNGRKQEVAS